CLGHHQRWIRRLESSKSHQEPLLTDWSLPQGRRHHSPPKTVRIDGKTISPGRFQVLQGI
ncbi:unnamed protein product, partial [Brassica rapa subsp. narinosa]